MIDFISGNALRVGYTSGGNTFNVVAGITGAGGTNNDSVRIWAGSTEENRYNAPFRVTQDGHLYADKANISGDSILGNLKITGYINGQDENGNGMVLFPEFIKFHDNYSAKDRTMLLGTINSLGYEYMGRIESICTGNYEMTNDALFFDIRGGLQRNLAIYGNGDLALNGNVIGYKCINAEFITTSNTINIQDYCRYIKIERSSIGNGLIGLPERSTVATKLGLGTYDDFVVPITIFCGPNHTGGQIHLYGKSRNKTWCTMYDNNGSEIGNVPMNKGDLITFLLVGKSSAYYALRYNHMM